MMPSLSWVILDSLESGLCRGLYRGTIVWTTSIFKANLLQCKRRGHSGHWSVQGLAGFYSFTCMHRATLHAGTCSQQVPPVNWKLNLMAGIRLVGLGMIVIWNNGILLHCSFWIVGTAGTQQFGTHYSEELVIGDHHFACMEPSCI
jgi:hypothetical protein